MSPVGRGLVDRMGELMSSGDVDTLANMYAADAEVVLTTAWPSGVTRSASYSQPHLHHTGSTA